MPKILKVLAVSSALLLSLAACSAAKAPQAAGCPAAPSGSSSAKVNVSGKLGVMPTVKFGSPLKATKTERSVIIDGKGPVAKPGDLVLMDLVAYNATTGKQISATTYKPGGTTSFALDQQHLLPGLFKAIDCSTVGSRVATIVPPADAFGTTGNTSLGVGANDSIVFVTDIESIAPLKATGTPQPAQTGFPTVTLAPDGTPTVTVPKAAAPTTLQVSVLKKGTGAVVKSGDVVTMQYQGVIWATGKVFDQSWGRSPFSTSTTGVIPGFGQALVGQRVGSQVIAVIPPALGYGAKGTTGISGTDTLVFVIDILAIQ